MFFQTASKKFRQKKASTQKSFEHFFDTAEALDKKKEAKLSCLSLNPDPFNYTEKAVPMEANTDSNQKKQSIIITICSTKGGVGKTTLAANIGGLLADLNKEHKVLLIDGDLQPTLSSYYQIEEKAKSGLTQLVKNEGNPFDAISKTSFNNLDIVLSNDPNRELQNWILNSPTGRLLFSESLKALHSTYDFIVIDSQGADEPIQHVTVLAGDILVSPISPDILSSQEFQRGTLAMLAKISPLCMYSGSTLGQLYGLIYKKNNTNDARDITEELISLTFTESKSKIRILNSYIPDLNAYRKAATSQLPVHRLDQRAKHDMCSLVSEILPNLKKACENFVKEDK